MGVARPSYLDGLSEPGKEGFKEGVILKRKGCKVCFEPRKEGFEDEQDRV